MEVKSFNEIYNDMKNYIIAHQDKLTDFNDGGVMASQIEAVAREITLLYVRCRIGFSSYLRSLPYSIFGFAIDQGTKSSTTVIFSRLKPFPYDTTIHAGTIVRSGGLEFLTVNDGTIPSGATDSDPIPVCAEKKGDKYNVGKMTINAIVSVLPADVAKVNNPSEAIGGKDAEKWTTYSNRFTDYIIGLQRTNKSGFISGLTNLARSVGIIEHFPPLEGIWNVTLYLENGSGSMTMEELAEAKKIIDGNTAKKIEGFRAPGINIRYSTPQMIPVKTNITVRINHDIIADNVGRDEIIADIKKIVYSHINGLKIGEPFYTSDLIIKLKWWMPTILDAYITFPEEDIPILQDQIARFQEANITVVS